MRCPNKLLLLLLLLLLLFLCYSLYKKVVSKWKAQIFRSLYNCLELGHITLLESYPSMDRGHWSLHFFSVFFSKRNHTLMFSKEWQILVVLLWSVNYLQPVSYPLIEALLYGKISEGRLVQVWGLVVDVSASQDQKTDWTISSWT